MFGFERKTLLWFEVDEVILDQTSAMKKNEHRNEITSAEASLAN